MKLQAVTLTDEQIEAAEQYLAERYNPAKWDEKNFGFFFIDVSGKHQVYYTLWRYRPSTSPYVEPITYICNLSIDLQQAVEKARRIAGIAKVEIDRIGTYKGMYDRKNSIIGFGKHRGEEIGELYAKDPQYVLWMNKASNEGKLNLKPQMAVKVRYFTEMYFETLTEKNLKTSASKFVGHINERKVFEVEITTVYDGKIKMKDADGNVLYSFTKLNVKKGDKVTVKATIAGHKEIVGVKQTYINRVAVIAVAAIATPAKKPGEMTYAEFLTAFPGITVEQGNEDELDKFYFVFVPPAYNIMGYHGYDKTTKVTFTDVELATVIASNYGSFGGKVSGVHYVDGGIKCRIAVHKI